MIKKLDIDMALTWLFRMNEQAAFENRYNEVLTRKK